MQFGRTTRSSRSERSTSTGRARRSRVRRPPVLPAHHEPPSAPPGRALRGGGDRLRPERGGGQLHLLAAARMSVPDVSGKAMPTWRWNRSGTWRRLPRRHDLRRDHRAGQAAHLRGDRGVVEVETRGCNQDAPWSACSAARSWCPPRPTSRKRGGSARPPGKPRAGLAEAARHATLAQNRRPDRFEQDILATVRDFTNREIIPVATELEHRERVPGPDRRGMKKLGLFGLTIGEEVRRPGRVPADLRPGRGGDRPRLDVGVGHHHTHFNRRPHDRQARHRRAEGLLPAPDGRRATCAAPSSMSEPAWLGRRGPSAPGRPATGTISCSTARRCG